MLKACALQAAFQGRPVTGYGDGDERLLSLLPLQGKENRAAAYLFFKLPEVLCRQSSGGKMEECQQEFKPQVGRLIAVIDRDKCVGLSRCKICMDNWCYATYGEDDKPMVDRNLCSSCNLCVIRCPHGARTLQYID